MGELDSLLLINSGDILTESILVLWIFFFFFFFYSFVNKRLYLLDAFHMIKHPSLLRSLKVTVCIQSHTVYYSRLRVNIV